MKIHIDIETRSPVDIKKSGVHAYAEQVEVLICCWAVDGGAIQTWTIHDGGLPNIDVYGDATYCAHNSQFERIVLLKALGIDIPIESWDCTMVRARQMNLPASLDGAAIALDLGQRKSPRGMALIRKFCVPPYQEPEGEEWDEFILYCRQDVVVERELDMIMFPMQECDKEVWYTDQRQNDRGICIDAELVQGALAIDKAHRAELIEMQKHITRLDNPNSPKQLREWLNEHGVAIDNMQAATIEGIDTKKLNINVAKVVEARQQLAQTASKKYLAITKSYCHDGKVRGILQYYGAGQTGRWAGRRVQPQNLPRGIVKATPELIAAVTTGDLGWLKMLYGDQVQGLLGSTLRAALIPPQEEHLVVVDYSAIECRVLAWLAGEDWVLEEFRGEGMIYEATAAKMYGVTKHDVTKPQRQNGKGATLGAGYGGGKAAVMAFGVPSSIAQKVVTDWRDSNPKIVRFWGKCLAAAKRGGIVDANLPPIHYRQSKFGLECKLPSGRVLYYPDAKPDGNEFIMGNKRIWAGILVENICQAVARDLLAHALKNCEREGLNAMIHIHDEIICYSKDPSDYEKLSKAMCDKPEWAKGLPLATDGYVTDGYYRK
jgi:DNA polymerase